MTSMTVMPVVSISDSAVHERFGSLSIATSRFRCWIDGDVSGIGSFLVKPGSFDTHRLAPAELTQASRGCEVTPV